QVTARWKKPPYADATKTYLPRISEANLQPKPSQSFPKHTPYVRKIDNRLFIRPPEEHPSRNNHVHAIKTVLTNKLEIAQISIKSVQNLKTSLAIVPTNKNHAESILGKAEAIVAILDGKAEKAEEWHTYLIDHVSRKLTLLEGSNWEATEELPRKEVYIKATVITRRLNNTEALEMTISKITNSPEIHKVDFVTYEHQEQSSESFNYANSMCKEEFSSIGRFVITATSPITFHIAANLTACYKVHHEAEMQGAKKMLSSLDLSNLAKKKELSRPHVDPKFNGTGNKLLTPA
ncbi:hypothetical protein EPUL_005235, partial [Erysiphe pulchra]